MSNYTTELRYLVDGGYNLELNDYPIFDESYRNTLNKKILDHYRYREIGFEVPGRFRHYLKTKMNEIMPFYNRLYDLEIEKINPLHNVDYTETYEKTADGTTGASSTSQIDSINSTQGNTTKNATDDILSVHSTTPSGMLSVGSIKSNTWADEAQIANNKSSDKLDQTQTGTNKDTSESTSTVNTTNNEDYIRKVLGTTGGKSKSELIQEYANTFLNIDMMIINDLNELFMGVY